MALIDLSSLNSINERYSTRAALEQAQRITTKTRLLIAADNKPIDLPKFNMHKPDNPCSEDIYFDIINYVKQEIDGSSGVIYITKRSHILWGTHGTLEIVNDLTEIGEGYIRYEFVLKDESLNEIYSIIDKFMDTRCGSSFD